MTADNLTRDWVSQARPMPTAAAADLDLRQSLFSPGCVAIVGQSDDASKTAGRPLKFLRQMGYAGRVYPINSRRESVLGERAWHSLAALPEVPDHAYIVTPTEAAVAGVEQLAQAIGTCGSVRFRNARFGVGKPVDEQPVQLHRSAFHLDEHTARMHAAPACKA